VSEIGPSCGLRAGFSLMLSPKNGAIEGFPRQRPIAVRLKTGHRCHRVAGAECGTINSDDSTDMGLEKLKNVPRRRKRKHGRRHYLDSVFQQS